MQRQGVLVLSVALLCGLALQASALKHSLKIRGDERSAFFIENFGFVPGGQLHIYITQFDVLYPLDASTEKESDFRVRTRPALLMRP